MVNVDFGLGRLPQFDDRSRLYQVRPLLEAAGQTIPRSYTWRVSAQLNQGSSGRCVGYAGAGELGASPVRWPATNVLANVLYELACKRDAWSENDSGDITFGTSVLALMQALKELEFIPFYHWCGAGSGNALEDFTLSLGYRGPVVVGTNWYSSMNSPGLDGHIRVEPASGLRGGHAYYFYRISIRWLGGIKPAVPSFADVDIDASRGHVFNSWGGVCNGWMTLREVGFLLSQGGEACVPDKRTNP